jgi:hypothetical protein
MYVAILEHWLGMDQRASDRLSWCVATSGRVHAAGRGRRLHGPAPIISSASESASGAWLTLGLLNQLGQFDLRLPPRPSWAPAALDLHRQGELARHAHRRGLPAVPRPTHAFECGPLHQP